MRWLCPVATVVALRWIVQLRNDGQIDEQADRAVGERQRGPVGLNDGRVEEPGGRAARVWLRLDQDWPGSCPSGRVGGGPAGARSDVDHRVAGTGPQAG